MFPLAILLVFIGAAAMPLVVMSRVEAAEERAEHWMVEGVAWRPEGAVEFRTLPLYEGATGPCVPGASAKPHPDQRIVEKMIAADTARRDHAMVIRQIPSCREDHVRLETAIPTPRARPARPRPVPREGRR